MNVLYWVVLIGLTLFFSAAVQMDSFTKAKVKSAAGKPATWLIALSVLFGTFLVVEAYEALGREPTMPARSYQVVRMVIALGGGFIAAGILGTLNVNGEWEKVTVKAGGPFGAVVLFYWVNPQVL